MKASEWRDTLLKLRRALLPPHTEEDEGEDISCSDLKWRTPDEVIRERISLLLGELEESTSIREFFPSHPINSLKVFYHHDEADKLINQIEDEYERDLFGSLLKVCLQVPLKSHLERELSAQKRSLTTYSSDDNSAIRNTNSSKCNYLPLQLHHESVPLAIEVDEVIVTVQIRSSHSNAIQAEFDLLGTQTLADLQSSVYCVQSLLETSEAENSFFFIEGKFYVEPFTHAMYPVALVSALRWLDENADSRMLFPPKRRKSTRLIGSHLTVGEYFKIRPSTRSKRIFLQNEIKVQDIPMNVGTRYLYCHKSGCEHFLYLVGIRSYNKINDLPHRSAYPRLTQQAKMKRRKCGVCEIWSAEFVVYYDRLAAVSPMFYCRHCHHMMHYRSDNSLLYDDFLVFPYLHDMQ